MKTLVSKLDKIVERPQVIEIDYPPANQNSSNYKSDSKERPINPNPSS